MATWSEFAEAAPAMAALGADRFQTAEVAYLGTVRRDGSPRVHPVTPIIGGGQLFLFMEASSPKGHDLRRDDRYTLHSLVTDQDGGGGEFLVRGRTSPTDDPAVRAMAADAAPYKVESAYVLFELSIEEASSASYDDSGVAVRQRWRES